MSWTLIEHQSLSSSAASVTLGSGGTIPQTYKTLKLVISARGSGNDLSLSLNGSTSSFTLRALYGEGTGAASATLANWAGYAVVTSYTANTYGSTELTFPNYAGSTNKPYSVDAVTENNATLSYQTIAGGLWSNTAAITSIGIAFYGGSGTFSTNSTFTLYGLA